MNKEQFLAMSLPHGLKIAEINGDGNILRISDLYSSRYNDFAEHDYYKPILHPLSNLTKEIEHKGERFVPSKVIHEFAPNDLVDVAYLCSMNYLDINSWPFWAIVKLVEWNFDIAGLIEKGEAIDVNTLSENPYK